MGPNARSWEYPECEFIKGEPKRSLTELDVVNREGRGCGAFGFV